MTSPSLQEKAQLETAMVGHGEQVNTTYPCHVIHSTTPYEIQFASFKSALAFFRFANGCGKALVADHGMVNIK